MQEGRKALVPAQRVVAAVPDFSWGWAGVAGSFWKVALSADDDSIADQARASGRQAADRAVALDSRNSEALWIKSLLIDRQDWIGREDLLKRAIAARRLDCGCEHHQYGEMLLRVGRVTEAVDQLRQADDMLALYVYTPLSLATALVAAGKPDEATAFFEAAEALAPNADFAAWIQQSEATATGNIDSILDPKLSLSPGLRAALVKGYRARSSQNADAKAAAVKVLVGLPQDEQNDAVAKLLADLGANHEAFQIAARLASHIFPGPSLFFYRDMRGTLNEQGFPALAAQLGLIKYWKATRTRPDVCNERGPPAFCRMI